jgi:hypothetical protein
MGIVRTSGMGTDAVYAGERMDGGARGVVSAGEAMDDEVFDIADGDDGRDVDWLLP